MTGTCVDLADNKTSDARGGLNLDKTAPVVQCAANPAVLLGPNKKMLPVKVALTFTDALAGPSPYAMTQLASSEAGGADDIAGFAIGSMSLGGSLRAESATALAFSRFYTLGYEGRDRAGNTAACSTTVTVPRDPQRSNSITRRTATVSRMVEERTRGMDSWRRERSRGGSGQQALSPDRGAGVRCVAGGPL